MVAGRRKLGGALLQAVKVVRAKVNAMELDVVLDMGTDGL
jgi:hypothetical protein